MIFGIRTFSDYVKHFDEETYIAWTLLEKSLTDAKNKIKTEDYKKTIQNIQAELTRVQEGCITIFSSLTNDPETKDLAEAIGKTTSEIQTGIDTIEKFCKETNEDNHANEVFQSRLYLQIQSIKKKLQTAAELYFHFIRRSLFKKAVKVGKFTAKAAVASLLAANMISQGLANMFDYLGKDLQYKQEGLAIFISYYTKYAYEDIAKYLIPRAIPAYVARVELAFGQKANIVKAGATKEDFFAALDNEKIQHIVLFGHGNWETWAASDGDVTAKELFDLYLDRKRNFKSKRGFLVRHTCGRGRLQNKTRLGIRITDEARYLKEEFEKLKKLVAPTLQLSFDFSRVDDYAEKTIALNSFIILTANEKAKEELQKTLAVIDKEQTINAAYPAHYGTVCFSRWVMPIHSMKDIPIDHNDPRFVIMCSAPKQINSDFEAAFLDFLHQLHEYLRKNQGTFELEKTQLGFPIYEKEQIKGWNRVAYPWDFMRDVFGENERKMDGLYAMAEKEKDEQS